MRLSWFAVVLLSVGTALAQGLGNDAPPAPTSSPQPTSSPPPTGSPCPTQIVITEPVCGTRYVNQNSVLVKGYVQGLSGGQIHVFRTGDAHTFDVNIPQQMVSCPRTDWQTWVPLICGCNTIDASWDFGTVRSNSLSVYQSAPELTLSIGGQVIKLGGCPNQNPGPCACECVGGTQHGTTATSAVCSGGSSCLTTDVISVTGSASTTDTRIRICGPLNSVLATVATTVATNPITCIQGYPFTASGLRLKPGQDRVTVLMAVGSTTKVTSSVDLCVNLTAPPTICLNFISPRDGATVTTPVTSVVGTVDPAQAQVTLRTGATTQPVAVSGAGSFSLPVTLAPGFNSLQLEADLRGTHVSTAHSVTYSTASTGPSQLFVTITQPVANSTLTTSPVVAQGRVTPGATLSLQTFNGATFPSVLPDGSWNATLFALPQGGNTLTASASLNGSIATSSVSFTLQTTSGGPPTQDDIIGISGVDPVRARAGTSVFVNFTVLNVAFDTPRVTIGGQPAELFHEGGNIFFYQRTLDGTESEGATTATIMVDRPGKPTQVKRVGLITDFTPPRFTISGLSSSYATTGSTVSFDLAVNELPDAAPIVTLGGAPMVLTTGVDTHFSYRRTILSTSTGQATIVTNLPTTPPFVAVDAASNGSWVALASTPTTGTLLPQARILDASDPLHPKLIHDVQVNRPIERVWLEGHRLIIGERDFTKGTGVGQIVGLSIQVDPVFKNFYRATMGFPEVQIPAPGGRLIHKQVEVSGNVVAVIDENQDSGQRTLSVSSLRAVTSEANPDETSRINVSGLDHLAIASSAVSTPPVILTVEQGKLAAYRTDKHFNLSRVGQLDPSSGTARKIFNKGNLGVLGRSDAGIDLVDLSDPAHLLRKGGVSIGGSLTGVAFDGHSLLAVTGNTVKTIDVSNLDAPRITGTTTLPSNAIAISAMRPIATAHGASGHNFLDLAYTDKEGPQTLRIEGLDLAGNPGLDTSHSVTVDYTPPYAVSVNVSPTLASRNTTVFIDVVASEPLTSAAVTIGGHAAEFQSSSGTTFHFIRKPDNTDVEGTNPVVVQLVDLAGLHGADSRAGVEYDFAPPVFSGVSISPSLAATGTTVNVTLSVNKTVRSTPAVTIGTQPANPIGHSGFTYTYGRSLNGTETEGLADVVADATSLAGNRAITKIGTITTDFTAPHVSNIQLNHTSGRAGTDITITFSVDEDLASNPAVLVGGISADYVTNSGHDYTFHHVLTGSETEGTAAISITVADVIGNQRTDTSASVHTDFHAPTPQNVNFNAGPLARGRTLTLTFVASENLGTPPRVTLGGVPLPQTGNSGLSYTFERQIGSDDVAGVQPLVVHLEDTLGNAADTNVGSVTLDFTQPEFSDVSASPPLAKEGTTVFIKFTTSKPLTPNPTVTVGGQNADFVDLTASVYTFKRPINKSEGEGTPDVVIRGTDVAGNTKQSTFHPLTTDFTGPSFTSFTAQPDLAKDTTAVTLTFTATETVSVTPTVTVGGQPASYVSSSPARLYTYAHTVRTADGEGSPDVVVTSKDVVGNTGTSTGNPLTTDFTAPHITNQTISPNIGKVGTEVTVEFTVDEVLGRDPVVSIGGQPATHFTLSGSKYTYKEPLSGHESDPATVSIQVQDRAGNSRTDTSLSLRTDFLPPTASNVSATPAYLKNGATLTVAFTASETMNTTPTVKVGARTLGFTNVEASNRYTFTTPIDGNDPGDPPSQQPITIHMVDDAGNVTDASPAIVLLDFVAPTFGSVNVTPTAVKANTDVTFNFAASETLNTTPTVTIGGKTVDFASKNGTSYSFTRRINGSEGEGYPELLITGTDLALNDGSGSFTPLRTDFTPPSATNLSAAPSPTTSNTTVTVAFTATETLNATPTVSIGGQHADFATLDSNRRYTFTRPIDGSETEGNALVSIGLVDLVGNTSTVTTTTVLDFHPPIATYKTITPSYLKNGASLSVTVDVNKTLGLDPTLTYGGKPAQLSTPQSGLEYIFTRPIDGSEGATGTRPSLLFTAQDKAGNISKTPTTGPTLDFIPPPLSVAVSPTAAKNNTQVTITVNTTETLNADPTVFFGAIQLPAPTKSGLTYTYHHTVLAGTDPETRTFIHVSADDLALNHSTNDAQSVLVEFTAPTAQNIHNDPLYATVGTTETMTFDTSAPVPTEPVVTIGSTSATKITSNGSSFTFARQIQQSDGPGVETITIAVSDAAGNTSSDATHTVTLDFSPPSAAVVPSPLYVKDGAKLAIDVTPSEALSVDPVVFVDSFSVTETQAGPPTYHFERIAHASDGDGLKTVNVTLTDLAGNTANQTANVTFDFHAPTFSGISTPPTASASGTLVTVRFDVNEPLSANPIVKIGGKDADFASMFGRTYQFTRKLDGHEGEPQAAVHLEATDLAGNTGTDDSAKVATDFTPPSFSNLRADPTPSTTGTVVSISFDTSEPLRANPTVTIGGQPTNFASLSLSGTTYSVTRVITNEEGSGTPTVRVDGFDVAGNEGTLTGTPLTLDFVWPKISNVTVAPSPATVGTTVNVTFTVDKPLRAVPSVTLTDAGTAFTRVGTGTSPYVFAHTVSTADGAGSKQIRISVIDLAGNRNSATGSLILDFTSPTAQNLLMTPTVASTRTLITATFTASETLGVTPTVDVAGINFQFQKQDNLDYTFTYTPNGSEPEGLDTVTTHLRDVAGNTGNTTTSVTLDFTSPTFQPISVVPATATTGTKLVVSFTPSEALRSSPFVSVGGKPMTTDAAHGASYSFSRTIDGSEGSGAVVIDARGTDVAGNPGFDNSARVTLDYVAPLVSSISVTPTAGKVGTQITVNFATSEVVAGSPLVTLSDKAFDCQIQPDGTYVCTRTLDGTEFEGTAPIRVGLTDPAGNKFTSTGPLFRTDFTGPDVTTFFAVPTIGTTGTTVTINVVANEPLAREPLVQLGGQDCALDTAAPPMFRYLHALSGAEPEGPLTARITMQDVVGNVAVRNRSGFTADYTPPKFVGLDVQYRLANGLTSNTTGVTTIQVGPLSAGREVIVTFSASEQLVTTPTVGAGSFTQLPGKGNEWVFHHFIDPSEPEATIPIPISGRDLAGNLGLDSTGSYITDFTAPTASSVNVTPTIATKGSSVLVEFVASESLLSDPLVFIGGQPAIRVRNVGTYYQYKRDLNGTEREGNNPVEIGMVDIAGNIGLDTSTSSIINFTPPRPLISAFPSPANEGAKVSFSALGSADASGIASVSWSFAGLGTSTSPVTNFAFPDGPATVMIDLTVVDRVGLKASTSIPLAVVNVSPTVKFDAIPTTVTGPTTITWKTTDPGRFDKGTVQITAQDLVTQMNTVVTKNVSDDQAFAWDTTTAKESSFQLAITVTDKDGGQGFATSNPFVVDNKPLKVTISGAQPRFFNPNFGEPTLLTYILSEHATVTVKVVSARDGGVIATLASNKFQLEGTQGVTWSGIDPISKKVFADGNYGYVVEAVDLAQLPLSTSSLATGITIVLKTAPPAPPVVASPPAITRIKTLVLTGTKESGTGIRVVTESGQTVVDSVPDDLTSFSVGLLLAEGSNHFKVFARDRAANLSTPVDVSVTLKTVPPSSPVITSVVPSSTAQDTLTITGTKDADTALIVNGATRAFTSSTTWTESFNLRAYNNNFTFQALDQAGNLSGITAATSFRQPNSIVPPKLTTSSFTRFTTLSISGTKQSNTDLSIQNARTDANVLLPITAATNWTASVALPDEETNTFTAVSTDSIGSRSDQASFVLVRDTQPPTIALLPGLAGAIITNTSITIGVNYADPPKPPVTPGTHVVSGVDTSAVILKLDGVNITSQSVVTAASASSSRTGLSTGTHRIEGAVADLAGNRSSVSDTFYVVGPDDGKSPAIQVIHGENTQFCPGENPYSDPALRKTTFSFSVSQATVTELQVLNSSGSTTLTTSVGTTLPTSTYSVSWDGTDNNKNLVKDGLFSVRFRATNFYGRSATSTSNTVRVHY